MASVIVSRDKAQVKEQSKEEWIYQLTKHDFVELEYNRNRKGRKNAMHKIYVKYRTFGDKDVLDLLYGIDCIDRPNTHAKESVYCQHWRHELTNGSKVEIFDKDNYFSKWAIGTCKSYN